MLFPFLLAGLVPLLTAKPTACGIERISDDTYADPSHPHSPEGGGGGGGLLLFANVFCFVKVCWLPPPIHRTAEVKDKIFCEDAHFLHHRCINTVENIDVEEKKTNK